MDIEELKKDIEVFIKGVERLEQLKAEFEKIDTSGYEKEAEEIRSMLKNVSAIPELEVKIANLKGAILRRHRLKKKYRNVRSSNVEKQIRELKEMILKKKIVKPGAGITRKELEESHQIPFIENQIKEIKEIMGYLAEHKGSKLTRKDLKNIKDVPKIEEQLMNLRLDIDEKFEKKLEE